MPRCCGIVVTPASPRSCGAACRAQGAANFGTATRTGTRWKSRVGLTRSLSPSFVRTTKAPRSSCQKATQTTRLSAQRRRWRGRRGRTLARSSTPTTRAAAKAARTGARSLTRWRWVGWWRSPRSRSTIPSSKRTRTVKSPLHYRRSTPSLRSRTSGARTTACGGEGLRTKKNLRLSMRTRSTS